MCALISATATPLFACTQFEFCRGAKFYPARTEVKCRTSFSTHSEAATSVKGTLVTDVSVHSRRCGQERDGHESGGMVKRSLKPQIPASILTLFVHFAVYPPTMIKGAPVM